MHGVEQPGRGSPGFEVLPCSVRSDPDRVPASTSVPTCPVGAPRPLSNSTWRALVLSDPSAASVISSARGVGVGLADTSHRPRNRWRRGLLMVGQRERLHRPARGGRSRPWMRPTSRTCSRRSWLRPRGGIAGYFDFPDHVGLRMWADRVVVGQLVALPRRLPAGDGTLETVGHASRRCGETHRQGSCLRAAAPSSPKCDRRAWSLPIASSPCGICVASLAGTAAVSDPPASLPVAPVLGTPPPAGTAAIGCGADVPTSLERPSKKAPTPTTARAAPATSTHSQSPPRLP